MPRGYWPLWVAALAFFFSFYALLILVPARLDALGLDAGSTALVIGSFGTAALLTRPIAGALADAPATASSSQSGDDLEALLVACNWNMSQAARRLGVNRSTVLRRMRKVGVQPPD